MRIFLIILWGIMAFISVTGTLYIIINYEIQRWKDRARRRQGAYIRRVNQAEALLTIFTPGFPCLGFFLHLVEEGSPGFWYELGGILMSIMFMLYAWYVHVAYVKISPEGIEQRMWSARTTVYPFNAINRVVFYKAAKYEDEDTVGFYAKSGTQIALFSPLPHKNYRLLAIVRFRIENERWPDMDNQDDVAQVNLLDCAGKTMRYFENLGKVTGLADVYM
ncbi:hypothetical protein [Rothia mucilaginosa]|uniref:Uncharacterized protein n=1 Tax=Rothia mucilaginosa TaxID=43675 RepID=A0A943TE09_9MICC|nr:hypothetical protein [Rothia mucilaginosa]MBS6635577.1 hypothetical protein [Rothia mucilaginosa]